MGVICCLQIVVVVIIITKALSLQFEVGFVSSTPLTPI